jgi:hypothetical protein
MKLSNERLLQNKIIFLEKSRAIWGDRYDYSTVERSFGFNIQSKVEIICREHGPWQVKACDHIRKGNGCPLCGRKKHKFTNEKFIAKSKEIHGNKYDYSRVNYKLAIEKVIITCFIHGNFSQSPNSHLGGAGCPKCGRKIVENSLRKTNQEKIDNFIDKCSGIFNCFYNYSKVKEITDYDWRKKVEIICPTHGIFIMRASKHMEGHGCKKCHIDSLFLTQEEFVRRGNEKFNFKFDYSLSDYKGYYKLLTIICPIHGQFEQNPSQHLAKAIGKDKWGCIKCYASQKIIYNEAFLKTTEQFVAEAKLVHGDRYDYSKSNYTGAWGKVEIICSIHGSFLQIATAHTNAKASGCPNCCCSVSKPETQWLDSLGIPLENRQCNMKINGRNFRFDAFYNGIAYEFDGDYFHGNPDIYDALDVNQVNKKTFGELYEKTISKRKYLLDNNIPLVWIWESEFIKGKKPAQ